jgi:hypothetical protein
MALGSRLALKTTMKNNRSLQIAIESNAPSLALSGAALCEPLTQPNDRQGVPMAALRGCNAAPIKLSGGRVC